MNRSTQLISILESEGLRIVDKRGLPAKSQDEKLKAWGDRLLLESFDSQYEYYDDAEALEVEEVWFKKKMGIDLTPRETHIAATLNF